MSLPTSSTETGAGRGREKITQARILLVPHKGSSFRPPISLTKRHNNQHHRAAATAAGVCKSLVAAAAAHALVWRRSRPWPQLPTSALRSGAERSYRATTLLP